MFNSIIDDIKNAFSNGNKLIQLIAINISVFIIIILIKLSFMIAGFDSNQLNVIYSNYIGKYSEMPLNFLNFIYIPYTIISYQFIHYTIFHLFFNMISLYVFGQILENVIGNKKTLALYLFGGITGALFALILFSVVPNLDPSYTLIGASAGIAAIIVAAATISPTYEIRLLFLGNIQVRYIALAFILFNLVSLPAFNNIGGSIAHLGGAFFGYIFIKQLQNGTDMSAPLNKFLDWFSNLFSKKSKLKIAHNNLDNITNKKHPSQKEVDIILDKISKSGYDSLSAAEKKFLFDFSNK